MSEKKINVRDLKSALKAVDEAKAAEQAARDAVSTAIAKVHELTDGAIMTASGALPAEFPKGTRFRAIRKETWPRGEDGQRDKSGEPTLVQHFYRTLGDPTDTIEI